MIAPRGGPKKLVAAGTPNSALVDLFTEEERQKQSSAMQCAVKEAQTARGAGRWVLAWLQPAAKAREGCHDVLMRMSTKKKKSLLVANSRISNNFRNWPPLGLLVVVYAAAKSTHPYSGMLSLCQIHTRTRPSAPSVTSLYALSLNPRGKTAGSNTLPSENGIPLF